MELKYVDIVGYEGFYKISNSGIVINRKGKILKNKSKKSGYLFVGLSKNKSIKYFHVHRLVAMHYIPNPENKPTVNHIDLIKTNNFYSNLEWCTYSENNSHARKNKTFKNGNKKGFLNKHSFQVAQLYENKIMYIWDSILSICHEYKISPTAIHKAIRTKNKSIGYFWEKITKEEFNNYINKPTKIPPMIINKRYRDLSFARNERIRLLNSITTEDLINSGVDCLLKNGSLTRKVYDSYAKENKVLTYIPVSKRFSTFKNFKKQVYLHLSDQLISKIKSPITQIAF